LRLQIIVFPRPGRIRLSEATARIGELVAPGREDSVADVRIFHAIIVKTLFLLMAFFSSRT
jgi:hypothetical protein